MKLAPCSLLANGAFEIGCDSGIYVGFRSSNAIGPERHVIEEGRRFMK